MTLTNLSYIKTWKTAIVRKKLSLPCKYLWLNDLLGYRILDYGCGKAVDVDFLNNSYDNCTGERNFDAHGYDIHKPFGHSKKPEGKFDTILLSYVLNVLLDPEDREDVICDTWSRLKPGGNMFVSVRSESDVKYHAKKSNWTPVGDGYITNSGTFQKGYTLETLTVEMRRLLYDCGAMKVSLPKSKLSPPVILGIGKRELL